MKCIGQDFYIAKKNPDCPLVKLAIKKSNPKKQQADEYFLRFELNLVCHPFGKSS